MKYKTIFFDLDGTITDSAPGIMNSIKYALEKNHLPMLSEEQLRSFIGPPLRGQFVKFVVLRMKKVRGWLKIIESITVTKGFLKIMYMTA